MSWWINFALYGLAFIGLFTLGGVVVTGITMAIDDWKTKRAAEAWLAQGEPRERCVWKPSPSEWGTVWREGCDDDASHGFMFENLGELGFCYCPYCGGEIHALAPEGVN